MKIEVIVSYNQIIKSSDYCYEFLDCKSKDILFSINYFRKILEQIKLI